jgi:hypothetical protein
VDLRKKEDEDKGGSFPLEMLSYGFEKNAPYRNMIDKIIKAAQIVNVIIVRA